MGRLDTFIEDLVVANRILATEDIVDAFGHISVRHPKDPDRYFLSRSRAPQCVETDDIMEFTLEGDPIEPRGRAPYFERFIHGAIYQMRPDAMSVIHSHSRAVIPFGVLGWVGHDRSPVVMGLALDSRCGYFIVWSRR